MILITFGCDVSHADLLPLQRVAALEFDGMLIWNAAKGCLVFDFALLVDPLWYNVVIRPCIIDAP